MSRVVLAGGSGLIGRALAGALGKRGFEVVVLSRSASSPVGALPGVRVVIWDGRSAGPWVEALEGAAAIVNLVGENLGEGRWSAARKRQLRESRLEPTLALVDAIEMSGRRPHAFLQASGVNYFGARGDEILTENAAPGSGFLPDLCLDWEGASARVESLGLRRVIVRTGVVLARTGGALAKMLPPFRLGIGGRLGSGEQWFSWIHLVDAVAAYRTLVENEELAGPFHLTAPEPATNATLTRELGRVLHRPTWLRVPGLALRFLYGEMAELVLTGQRVVPRRLLESGFEFRFPGLGPALDDLLPRRP